MRLWSLHPSYLDRQGLLACWREGLLARKVFLGQTKGYRNHPQLERFKMHSAPLEALDGYLLGIFEESLQRGYSFDRSKIGECSLELTLTVTVGQLIFELEHLKYKLHKRDMERYDRLATLVQPLAHPLFEVIPGEVETWERIEEG